MKQIHMYMNTSNKSQVNLGRNASYDNAGILRVYCNAVTLLIIIILYIGSVGILKYSYQ